VERRGGGKPRLSDLRESGAIEQDADMVIFIHRPSYYRDRDRDDDDGDDGCGELLVEKNRDGPTGKVPFRYGVGMACIFDAPSPGQETPPPPPPANATPYVSYYEPADREPF
jgi:replicative DNA helicase